MKLTVHEYGKDTEGVVMDLSDHIWIDTAVRIKSLDKTGVVVNYTRGKTPYKVKTLDGQVYSCGKIHLQKLADDSQEATDVKEAINKAEEDAFQSFCLGAVVTIEGREGQYVVIKVPVDGRVNVAKLGGDGNRYVKALTSAITIAK